MSVKQKKEMCKKKQTVSGGKRFVLFNPLKIRSLWNWSRLRKTMGEFYLETDTSQGTFVIGKGRQRINLTTIEAKMLGEWLKYHQSQLSSDM